MQFHIDKTTNIQTIIKQIRSHLVSLKANIIEANEIITICSELIYNIQKYTPKGYLELIIDTDNSNFNIKAKDNGDGFINISNIIKENYSTSGTLGAGLPAIIRLSDEFEAISNDTGVQIIIAKRYK